MAQKAAKSLAVRNTATLSKLHLISISIHGLFLLLRLLIFRNLSARASAVYVALSFPAALIEFWFERNSRPKYNPAGDLTGAGDDLDARGTTEYLFDVMYWTWGTIALAAVFGDKAWWMWIVVPTYSLFAGYKAATGVRDMMGGLAGSPGSADEPQSNRQKKMEKRDGQKMQYR